MKKILEKIGITDVRNIIAVITVIGCFTCLFALQFHSVPSGNRDLLNIGMGFILGGGLGMVYGYYFGGNKKDKGPDAEK